MTPVRKGITMVTLVIHAPDYRVKKSEKRESYETIFKNGKGKNYAIYNDDAKNIKSSPNVVVVLLRKDRNKKRAEGCLIKIIETDQMTRQGIRRYDVYFKNQLEVEYKSENLNHCGVAIIYS